MTKIFTLRQVFCCLLLVSAGTGAMAQNLTDETALKAKILKNISRTGISPAYLKDAHITDDYKEKQTGIEHVYLQQTYQGIDVYNELISLAFKDDKLLYASGKFINAIEKKAGASSPSLSAQDAVLKAASHLNLTALVKDLQVKNSSFTIDKKIIFSSAGISKKDIETKLYWTVDSLNKLHLTWNVNIDVINKPDWWNVRVDALSGSIVQKDNWTVYEGAGEHAANDKADKALTSISPDKASDFAPPSNSVTSAVYNVIPYPADNRNVQPFTQVTNPWEAAGTGNNATTYGWQYDGAASYTITRGNNVYAYEDRAATNKVGKTGVSVTPLPNLHFTAAPNFSKQPTDSVNQLAAITNLFYWNNQMHDVMYQYGFDETAGNFQADNMLRGGKGNDYVLAEAQDGGGTNNANFSTPADGSSGRMQMYLWNSASNLTINTPSSIAGSYTNIENQFVANNKLATVGPKTGRVVYYSTTDTIGCTALPPGDSVRLKGKIAIIYRGTCAFTVKVKNAQNVGAIGVIMVNNQGAPFAMSGTDNTIKIPAVMISTDDGAIITASIRKGDSVSATMKNDGILLDGDLDNGIVCHEYGHGVSTRLTGGPAGGASCLSNGEEAGEGWSDYQGLMMTTNWATEKLTDGPTPRGVGTYAYGEGYNGVGIRSYPYSTNLAVNPLTYANMASNTEVHAIGEIWCTALWDMTWNIIQQEGKIEPNLYNASSNGGNVVALQLVLEGMKLQTCNPGFLDARDAILAADSILYGFKHKCAIWNAFAKRGMGVSAIEGSPNDAGDGTAAFNVPGVVLTKVSDPMIVNGQFSQSLTATCGCAVPAGSYTLRDTIPSGFTYVSSIGGTASGSVVSFPLSFNSPLQVKTVSVTLSAPKGCAIDTLLFDDRDTHTSGGFTSSTTVGKAGWKTDTVKSYSPTHSWYAPDGDTTSQYLLTSASFQRKDSLAILSFWHYISTEYGFDGGLVEIQTNGGAWRDASPYFLKNGYNAVIDATVDSIFNFPKTAAFTGTPFSVFSQTLVDLTPLKDSTIQIRFRIHSDQYSAVDGWYIDNISVADGCGGFQKIGLYSDSGKIADTYRVPVFSTPSVLPVTLIGFTAEAQGNSALLKWETASEINMKEYAIEASKDGASYNVIGSALAKGTSSSNYSLYDFNPYNGWNYYRIKMINTDGSFTYSPVRSVLFTNKGLIAVRPNPATSSATVYIDKDLKVSYISLTDMQGKLIRQVNGKNIGSNYTLNTSSLASGTNLVKITPTEGTPVTVKLVVQH